MISDHSLLDFVCVGTAVDVIRVCYTVPCLAEDLSKLRDMCHNYGGRRRRRWNFFFALHDAIVITWGISMLSYGILACGDRTKAFIVAGFLVFFSSCHHAVRLTKNTFFLVAMRLLSTH
jgi:hypothetical protein